MLGIWDVRDMECSGCGMLGMMWDVPDVSVWTVGCWGCGMFGMWDRGCLGCVVCSGCGMFRMWNDGHVECLGCGM